MCARVGASLCVCVCVSGLVLCSGVLGYCIIGPGEEKGREKSNTNEKKEDELRFVDRAIKTKRNKRARHTSHGDTGS